MIDIWYSLRKYMDMVCCNLSKQKQPGCIIDVLPSKNQALFKYIKHVGNNSLCFKIPYLI